MSHEEGGFAAEQDLGPLLRLAQHPVHVVVVLSEGPWDAIAFAPGVIAEGNGSLPEAPLVSQNTFDVVREWRGPRGGVDTFAVRD